MNVIVRVARLVAVPLVSVLWTGVPLVRVPRAVPLLVGLSLAGSADAAWAHPGAPLAPHDLATAWILDPVILSLLGITGWGYTRGLGALWRGSAGRGIRRWEAAAFLSGWVVLAIALVSPVHTLGEVLFSGHMAQHQLMMGLAAPLLVLGRPLVPWLWAMPIESRRLLGRWTKRPAVHSVWRTMSHPLIALLLQAVVIVVWHLPTLYLATLTSEIVHALQHGSFLGSALLFWYAMLHGWRGRTGYGTALVCLFATALLSGALGALLTFAPRPWYDGYAATGGAWGLTALEDQQLAGLIMWIPGGISYLVGGLLLLRVWLAESERKASQWQASALPSVARRSLVVIGVCLIGGVSVGCGPDREAAAAALTGGDPAAGRERIGYYGCGACHTVPGVAGANRQVGPPLTGLPERMFIAGVLANNPANLIRWIESPTAVDPLAAMPDLGVTPADARDIAAYLYTLR